MTAENVLTAEEFEQAAPVAAVAEPTLVVDVEGFEGPLDLLLTLARAQKVDLAKISIVALADQYLKFVEEARRQHLELAADYLVMAAWLAYLKSRLLIPNTDGPGDEPSAADLASALAHRLRRLEAIRAAATALMGRPQLGRDTFERGDPEPVNAIKRPEYSATLYDLLSAYAVQRRKTALSRVRFAPRAVWSLADARAALQRLAGISSQEWSRLDEYLIAYVVEPSMRASVLASSFAATLELVREGALEMHQAAAFAPLYLRGRVGTTPEASGAAAPGEPVNQ
jgi:segregation and condensation protein A